MSNIEEKEFPPPMPTAEDKVVINGLQWFYYLITGLPAFSLLLLLLFSVAVTFAHGQWPAPGQPDPKSVGWVSTLLYWPTFLTIVASVASPFIWVMFALFAQMPKFPVRLRWVAVVGYWVGLLLLWGVMRSSWGVWLLD